MLAIYLGVSWVVFEIVQTVTEGLGLPEWFPSAAAMLLLLGLPIVLATAFVQEGIAPTERPDPTLIPDADQEAAAPEAEIGRVRRLLSWRNALIGGVLAFALWGVVAAGWLLLGGRPGPESRRAAVAVDESAVAVLPFRVAGADPSLHYLREGMLDLLAAKLTGEGGPRAVDPRAVMSAWRRAAPSDDVQLAEDTALQVARSVGAGQLLLGGVVGTPARVVLNATLRGVPGGRTLARADVEGPMDSLTALVDGLTAQLLAREAGETEQRLATLTSTSLPALRAYLDGQAAYRRGSYGEAAEHYGEAIDHDSTFALAGMGLALSRWWLVNRFDPAGLEVAWDHRDRLSERDRAFLLAVTGPDYPRPGSMLDWVRYAERAVEAAPDRPEHWYWLGEAYYHAAPALEVVDNPHAKARSAFARAVAFDSTFAPALAHLTDLAVAEEDTAAARRLADLYLAVDSTGELREFHQWEMGRFLADTSSLERLRARFGEIGTAALRAIVRNAQLRGAGLEDAERAAAVLRDRLDPRPERFNSLMVLRNFELNRGRPGAAAELTEEISSVAPVRGMPLMLTVLHALYGNGDQGAAARAVDEMAGAAEEALNATDGVEAPYYELCTVALWRAWHGELARIDAVAGRLRAAPELEDLQIRTTHLKVCAAMIEAVAERQTQPAGRDALRALDELMRTGPPGPGPVRMAGNLTAARLFEEAGDLDRALAATRRRMYFDTAYLASFLRLEGRLAEVTGDRKGAIRAYRHYIALRSDPAPELEPEVARVRAELAKLVQEDTSQ